VSRLRDNEADFEGAVVGAAERLGLAPLFVEKDYWVTQVLRALHDQHAGAFVLKGGTSLSKGYELIERFSEDVDILIQPAKGDSAKSRERLLQTIAEHVAHTLDIDWLPAREPGRGKTPHRADVLSYPRVVRSAVAIPVEDRGVLLETGYAGGEWPSEMVTLTPMLCEPLGLDPSDYEDTVPFDVRALLPMRTLLEKISLLHHVATRYTQDATVELKWRPTPDEEEGLPTPEGGYFCPYCAVQAPPDSWWTKAQLEAVEAKIHNEAVKPMLDDFGKSLERASSSHVRITSKPADRAEEPQLSESDDMRRVDFSCHPSEPVKVLDGWDQPVHCLICGQPATAPQA